MTRTACLNAIYELAKVDERVIFIGSDLSPNTLADFKKEFPNRFMMEGIQEQNVIGMAAGLALEGFIPYVNTIATFITRRCYEQVAMDICAHNLPVRLIGNGGGVLYAPLGPTHLAVEDIAIMRALPNMSVVCCGDNEEMKEFMPRTLDYPGPMYIRLGKDSDPVIQQMNIFVTEKSTILLIGTGVMSFRLMEVLKILLKNEIYSSCIHMAQIKPLDENALLEAAHGRKLIVTAEEGIRSGGLGTAVLEALNDNGINIPVLRLGLPDAFPNHYGEQDDLLETYGLQPEQIAQKVREAYAKLS